MILLLALSLAATFGAVGAVTGHRIALRQTAQERAETDRLHAQAIALANTITQSPAASLDPEAVQQARNILTNSRKDLNN